MEIRERQMVVDERERELEKLKEMLTREDTSRETNSDVAAAANMTI